MKRYQVFYEIRSGMDGWEALVSHGDVTVHADNVAEAKDKAITLVHVTNPYCNDRIDPLVSIVGTRVERV